MVSIALSMFCEGVQPRMLWPELNTTKLWILVYEFGRSLLSMLDRYDNRLQDSENRRIQENEEAQSQHAIGFGQERIQYHTGDDGWF